MLRIRIKARGWVLLILVAIGATEYGLRWAGFANAAAVELDPNLGWRKQPNQSVPGLWGEGVEINGHGFRDRAWAAPDDPEKSVLVGGQRGLRVALLGDSLGYGARLVVEQGSARLLELGLRAQSDADVLVQNFCIPGWTLEQMVAAYEFEASAWKPDVVVLLVDTACLRPAVPVTLGADYPLRRTLERSAVWDFLRRNVWRNPQGNLEAAPRELRGGRDMIREPFGRRSAATWSAAGEHLAQLNQALLADDAKLLVVLVPRLVELTGDPWRSARAGDDQAAIHWQGLLGHAPGARFLDLRLRFRRSLEPVIQKAAKSGIPLKRVWGSRPTPQGEALIDQDKHPYLILDSLHLSARGHAILATEVFLELGRSGWIPELPSPRK